MTVAAQTVQSSCSLHAAVVCVARLERSFDFYHELLGLDVLAEGRWAGPAFARHFGVDVDSARYVLVGDRRAHVGSVLLVEFPGSSPEPVRGNRDGRFYGHVNLNAYAVDIRDATRMLDLQGFRAWAPPAVHRMAPEVGAPTVAMIDGPDGVILNLVELTTRDPATQIGRMRRRIQEDVGYNSRGLTAVATTQHCVNDADAAAGFYRHALGMRVLIEDRIETDEQNRSIGYPPGTRARTTFLGGWHPFGKVALVQPLNATFDDVAASARPPRVGYLAQSFVVPDLAAAVAAGRASGAVETSPCVALEMPALGLRRVAMLTVPGSGALVQLIDAAGSGERA
jgi:catechol 2,3-dioxygenase-like lactoylglutathione lyase family enzyme